MIGSILAGAAGVTATALAAGLGWRRQGQRRAAEGLAIAGPGGIVEEGFVRVGSVDQWIGIRGEDRTNPALLVLHGGPGAPFSMFTPVMRAWEREFTIVQWDQPGAGKTFGRNGAAGCAPLSFARLIDDAARVAEHVRERLQVPLVLLAGSMGNMIGAPLARRRPDLFAAYVATDFGVGRDNEARSYAQTLARLREAGNRRGVAELEAIGAEPWRWDLQAWQRKQRWILKTDPRMREVGRTLLMPSILTAPGYTLRDVFDLQRGMEFSAAQLYGEFIRYDVRREGTRFELPFFLFQGDDDVFTQSEPAQQFFAEVEAPHKEFAAIRDAGHFAAFTRPQEFLEELRVRVLPQVLPATTRRRAWLAQVEESGERVALRLDDRTIYEGTILEVEGETVMLSPAVGPFDLMNPAWNEDWLLRGVAISIEEIVAYVDDRGRWRALIRD
ncbi:alpha/beta hydrolase [Nannocystis sp. ILAH1]|uniref:alpha/beta fold hydrolase n=1 Tax=Nannocystis sp. ILAH1 TaxID=2996789 RepID=UPI00226D99E9|nr:alpha/beta hydrolase [Nannocystis sp. ILAH1]MCY0994510.1 alpha/beta hydrolase [Nannocystis sp. ILAH1]